MLSTHGLLTILMHIEYEGESGGGDGYFKLLAGLIKVRKTLNTLVNLEQKVLTTKCGGIFEIWNS